MRDTFLKNGEAILVASLAVFAPIKSAVIVAVLAVIVDFITGILAARKQKIEIKSSKMGVTLSKLVIVLTSIVMSFLIQTYLLQDAFPLTTWVSSLIGTKLAFSIFENINVLSDDKFFTDVLTRLVSMNAKKDQEERKASTEEKK